MYPSEEKRPGPSQATKINLLATIVNVFNPFMTEADIIF